jgi:hypothetical protein
MHTTKMLLKSLSIAGLAILLSACASQPKVRVDQDANTNFGSYKTFAWFSMEVKEGAPAVDPLSGQRIRSAVSDALQAKGYTLAEANPDFRVSYVLHVYERPKESGMRIGVGAGGGSGNVGGGVGLSIPVGKRNESVAALTVDIIDAARNAQVWTASYEEKLKDKDVSDAEAQTLVSTVLAKYPARAAQ